MVRHRARGAPLVILPSCAPHTRSTATAVVVKEEDQDKEDAYIAALEVAKKRAIEESEREGLAR